MLFKQFFSDWKDKDETTGPTKAYTIGKIAKVEQIPFDASTLHTNNTMAAQHGMVDNGEGKVQVRALKRPGSEAREISTLITGCILDLACGERRQGACGSLHIRSLLRRRLLPHPLQLQ